MSALILAALQARERTGRGQRVEVTLFGTSVAAMVNQAANHLIAGVVPRPMGNAHPNIVPYQVFHAADGPFVLAVGNDAQFAKACGAIGRPDLAADPRFATNAGRVRDRETLLAELEACFLAEPVARWLQAFDAAGVPAGPVRDLHDVFASPEGRTMVASLPDAARGALPIVRQPIELSSTPATYRRPPPGLGEHTAEVLDELGSSAFP